MSEHSGSPAPAETARLDDILASLDNALGQLEQASPVAHANGVAPVLELAQRLLLHPAGTDPLYRLAPRLEAAGVFHGSDWERPQALLPGLVRNTLNSGDGSVLVLEALSELRFLAVANGEYVHGELTAEQARHFLTQVLALNLDRLFDGGMDEATRAQQGNMTPAIDRLLHFLLDHVGFEDILGNLINEIWRILGQRPLQIGHVKAMVTQIAVTLSRGGGAIGEARLGSDRLISALFGPTQGCNDDPGLAVYRSRLETMDQIGLQQEAYGFARAMHDTGMVSDYHPTFIRWLLSEEQQALLPDALGLSSTGIDSLRCYSELVNRLIKEAVYPETAQAVYGLAMLLDQGVLYSAPIGPGLWRQIGLVLSDHSNQVLTQVFGTALPPRVYLLAGVISLLGQPLGVGQGNNPTCQAARALSMWAFNDPDYLLNLVAQVARFDHILMHFEGSTISSHDLPAGLVATLPLDTDPVSTLLVPHLDRIYLEMGRLCASRGEDPHRWINPEFHGWWVGREFYIAVDVATGNLHEHDAFLRQFYTSYHPLYNGNQPLIHPQPAGLAVTDSNARFVGWHAITLLRVALDPGGVMRVYFFNPNNDSGQDWGHGVVVSTQGHGERYGEASMPFNELASRLYLFHDEPLSPHHADWLPEEEIQGVMAMAVASWAADRVDVETAPEG